MKRINVLLNTDKSYTYQFKSTTLYVTANSLYFYLGMLSGRNIWYIATWRRLKFKLIEFIMRHTVHNVDSRRVVLLSSTHLWVWPGCLRPLASECLRGFCSSATLWSVVREIWSCDRDVTRPLCEVITLSSEVGIDGCPPRCVCNMFSIHRGGSCPECCWDATLSEWCDLSVWCDLSDWWDRAGLLDLSEFWDLPIEVWWWWWVVFGL